MQSRQAGQSLTEYGLLGSLIGVGGLLALFSMGGNLGDMFQGMVHPGQSNTVLIASAGAGTGSSVTAPLASNPGVEGLSGLQEGASNGQGLPKNLPGMVQTMGANGSSQVLANQIKQIGSHLLAKGEITAAQATTFAELANEGNRISAMEKLIEDSLKNGNQSINFEGQTYSVYDFSRKVGWVDDSVYWTESVANTGEEALSREPGKRSESLQSFLSSYEKLKKSGGLSNPTVQMAVSSLTAKIAALSEVVEYSVSDLHWGNPTEGLQDNLISNTSYWSSSQICDYGTEKTVGVTCK